MVVSYLTGRHLRALQMRCLQLALGCQPPALNGRSVYAVGTAKRYRPVPKGRYGSAASIDLQLLWAWQARHTSSVC